MLISIHGGELNMPRTVYKTATIFLLVAVTVVAFTPSTAFALNDMSDAVTDLDTGVSGATSGAVDTGPLNEVMAWVFGVASLLIKAFLGLMAFVKAASIAQDKQEGLKDFAYVIGAFLLYFMLPWLYDVASQLGSEAGR